MNIDQQYKQLLALILEKGVEKNTRNGRTLSLFGQSLKVDLKEGFPLLTTKKMFWKGIVGELLWFLSGSTDIRDLWKKGVHIWDADWYREYSTSTSSPYSLKQMQEFSTSYESNQFHPSVWDLGPIYGHQWKAWNGIKRWDSIHKDIYWGEKGVDQIQNLVNTLKTNPDSRRMLVNSWNPSQISEMVLPPCHYSFQVYTEPLSRQERLELLNEQREYRFNESSQEVQDILFEELNIPERRLDLLWNQRSVDSFLGLPFNIASYGLLTHLLANEVNMVPGNLVGVLGDTHLYEAHVEQAREQLERKAHPLPSVSIKDDKGLDATEEDVTLSNYQSEAVLKAPLLV